MLGRTGNGHTHDVTEPPGATGFPAVEPDATAAPAESTPDTPDPEVSVEAPARGTGQTP
jgi:hypothetical protein